MPNRDVAVDVLVRVLPAECDVIFSAAEDLSDFGLTISAGSGPMRPLLRVEVLGGMFPSRDGRAAERWEDLREISIARDHDDKNHAGDGETAKGVQRCETLRRGLDALCGGGFGLGR